MTRQWKFVGLGFVAGILWIVWLRPIVITGVANKVVVRPSSSRNGSVLRAHELNVTFADGTIAEKWGLGDRGAAPGFWINDKGLKGTIQGGVHANGFPFLLVSDGKVQNFGLGRVDGKNASPILVFRSDDIVRMVFGLSMTESGQPPFLVHYSNEGKKSDFIGQYCDAPSRVCVE